MNKNLLRGYILIAFEFLIYVIVTVPFQKNTVFWIVFVFSILSILVQIAALHFVMKSQGCIQDRIYDFPIIRMSTLYLLIQFLASLLFMGFSDKIPIFAAVLTEMVILLTAVTGFYFAGAARREVLRQDKQLEKELEKGKEWQARLGILLSQCGERQIREILGKLSEEIRYSNPISREVSEDIEEEIAVLLTEVEAAALAEDIENTAGLCERMTALLRERDRICKYGK